MLPFLVLYLVFLATVMGFAILIKRIASNKRDRLPFPDNIKLLRGPGETIRARLDDQLFELVARVVIISVIPVTGAFGIVWVAVHLDGVESAVVGAALIAAIALLCGWQIRITAKQLQKYRNDYLGYFGERVVSESLDELKAESYRVFHDVPCEGKTGKFNIDHVVVGPSGVYAIETKTRRKGRSRDGYAAHEIIYDGQVLAYPWGEDRFGLEQASNQALWLEDWLQTILGKRTFVQPILTFPGWMVITRKKGSVAVLNPKMIISQLRATTSTALDAREIDLISRQLDSRCRDVAFG